MNKQTPHKTLTIDSSPHIRSGNSVDVIMRNVVYALLPVIGFAIYSFGLAAALIIATAVVSCVLTEHMLVRISAQEITINDWSATITGIIFGLTLPPGLPLWMVVIGGFIAIALGKFLFGGLGCNAFNPALVGRAFLQAAFPVSLTTWSPAFLDDRFVTVPASLLTLPFMSPSYSKPPIGNLNDAISGATPLSALKFDSVHTEPMNLFLGISNGSLGETSSLIILVCGLYLILRNMMNWRIPAGVFISVAIISSLFNSIDATHYAGPLFMLFSGGLMFGAMFMATDMVASPITNLGCFIYGVLIGSLIVVIRYWSGLPEGVMYALLFCNALSPHIDTLIQPHVFGKPKPNRKLQPNKPTGHQS